VAKRLCRSTDINEIRKPSELIHWERGVVSWLIFGNKFFGTKGLVGAIVNNFKLI